MNNETIIYQCSHIGVSGTTPVHVKNAESGYVARCGIAIMGATNMDESGFKACNYDPFHPQFYDNYSEGRGATETQAIDALKQNMKSTADSLWAF